MEPLSAGAGAASAGDDGTMRPLPVLRTPAPVARPLANTSRRLLEEDASNAPADAKRNSRYLMVAKSEKMRNDVLRFFIRVSLSLQRRPTPGRPDRQQTTDHRHTRPPDPLC